jgi:hypothetical protein
VKKTMFLTAATVALACAGFATAGVVAKTIRLHGGQSVQIGKTKVMCLAKTIHAPGVTQTITVTQTVTAPTKTVTVTAPVQTVTVTTSVATPPTTTSGGGSPVTKDFSGNGDQTLDPFTTTFGEHLYWTWQNTNGDFPTGMFINDESQLEVLVNGDGNTTSGSTYLAPGLHTLQVITIGNWTIRIGP